MSTIRTYGVTLSKKEIGENDRIYVMYSKDMGKIEAVARGSRKILSKLAPHLEPPIFSDIMIARGRRVDKLAGALSLNTYSKIKSDFLKIQVIFSCLRILDALTRFNQKDERIWNLLEKFLEICEDIKKIEFREKGIVLQNSFFIKLLTILGYKPELKQCISCRNKNFSPPSFFDCVKGGIVCDECGKKVSSTVNTLIKVDSYFLEEINFLLSETFKNILSKSSFKISEKTKKTILALIKIHAN